MQIYKDIQLCTGCSNCANICPKKCVSMQSDDKGFLYPIVDTSLCINCLKCQSVCPTYAKASNPSIPKLYAYTNSDEETLIKCSSGGAFGSIAEKIISVGGYVCGAIWTTDFSVKHIITNKLQEIKKMYGSKYLQSDLNNCFVQIKSLLEDSKTVLFCGAPCQVLALKNFLQRDYQNLLTIDFICHSIPSPKIFKAYKNSLEKSNGRLSSFHFRDKTHGWENYSLCAEFENKKELYPHKGNLYMELFLDGIITRECCASCPVKTITGYASDITLGDFWGAKTLCPELYNENGVSAIITHTQNGKDYIKHLTTNECDFDSFIKINSAYNTPHLINEKASLFWRLFNKYGLKKAGKQIYKKSFLIRLKTAIKKFFKF